MGGHFQFLQGDSYEDAMISQHKPFFPITQDLSRVRQESDQIAEKDEITEIIP